MKLKRYKFILFVGLFIVVCILIAFWGFYSLQRYSQRINLKNKLISIEQNVFSKAFSNITYSLDVLSESETINKYFSDPHTYEKEIEAVVDNSNTILQSSMIYLMDSLGDVLVSTQYDNTLGSNHTLVGKNYSFRPYFKSAIEGDRFTYPAVGITTKKRGIYFSSPVFNNNDRSQTLGVLVLKLGAELIENALADFNNDILVISPEGIVFFSNKDNWLYYKVDKQSTQPLLDLNKSMQFNRKEFPLLPFEIDNTYVEVGDGSFLLEKRAIGDTGWDIVILYPESNHSILNKEIKVIILTGLLLIIMVLFLLLLLVRSYRNNMVVQRLFPGIDSESKPKN